MAPFSCSFLFNRGLHVHSRLRLLLLAFVDVWRGHLSSPLHGQLRLRVSPYFLLPDFNWVSRPGTRVKIACPLPLPPRPLPRPPLQIGSLGFLFVDLQELWTFHYLPEIMCNISMSVSGSLPMPRGLGMLLGPVVMVFCCPCPRVSNSLYVKGYTGGGPLLSANLL